MPPRPASRVSSRRGVATVELALLLPFLLFLFVVVFDFARVYHFAVVTTSCAYNGALYAANPTWADKMPYANATEAALADAAGLKQPPTVTVREWVGAGDIPWVEVTVVYVFHTATKFPGIPRTVPITRTVCMRRIPEPLED